MPKNIFIIAIDNLRYDCCEKHPDKGWLDKFGLVSKLKTPTLNKIAEKSTYFTNAFSTATYTTNAFASLFTGLYPPKHGVRSFFKYQLNPRVNTLAEILKQNSYDTLFMSDNKSLFEFTGLLKGFTSFTDDEDVLIDRIKSHSNKPIFAFAHFFDVHDPYLFSPKYKDTDYNKDYFDWLEKECKKHSIDFLKKQHEHSYYELFYKLSGDINYFFPSYVNGVNKFDEGRFGKFCERLNSELKVWDDWIVVLLSDHGEGRIDNTMAFRHEGLLYDDTLRIVLMLSDPDSSPRTCNDLASIVDVFPTILSRTGARRNSDRFADVLERIDGMVLPNNRKTIYAETWQRRKGSLFTSFDNDTFLRQRVVRSNIQKTILNGNPEKFLRTSNVDSKTIKRGLLCEFEESTEEEAKTANDVVMRGLLREEGTWKANNLLQVILLEKDPLEIKPMGFDKLDLNKTITTLSAIGEIYKLEDEGVKLIEIKLFSNLVKRIEDFLERLQGGSLVIYGAGEHTKMLLRETPIRKGRIIGVVDSDSAKWGKEIEGLKITPPTSISKMNPNGILISSHAFQDEIYEFLVKELKVSEDKIFCLYGRRDNDTADEKKIMERLKSLGYL